MKKEFGGLGFRDIYAFNLAMLGKQGWKLITEPNATMSRIIKAKYFLREDFLQQMVVSDLISLIHHNWNREVLNLTLEPRDITAVLRIPLNNLLNKIHPCMQIVDSCSSLVCA